MASIKELVAAAEHLPPDRLGVLVDLAEALGRHIAVRFSPASDLVNEAFAEDFSGRLLAYHAFHDEKLTKKTFEFLFAAACRATGHDAEITGNTVFAGADVTVDGVAFSLKTEGARSMSRSSITVSKLMEARWIRDCRAPSDFAREVAHRVVEHLSEYQRVLILRAFETATHFEYDLVEIPVAVLRAVSGLLPDDFSPRTRSGGTSAHVMFEGNRAFTLRLDGSVEKVTVAGLQVDLCTTHSRWKVRRQLTAN